MEVEPTSESFSLLRRSINEKNSDMYSDSSILEFRKEFSVKHVNGKLLTII